jgi:hypothetical protein
MKPVGKKLTVTAEPIPEKKGSLYIPENARKKLVQSRMGIVKELGDVPDFDFEVEIGDRIQFNNRDNIHEDNNEVLIPKGAILFVYE